MRSTIHCRLSLSRRCPTQSLFHMSKTKFSNVWGERTMQWMKEVASAHIRDNEDDYSFKEIPALQKAKDVSRQRVALITPCVSSATCSFFIDEMIKQKYYVHSLAMPTADTRFIRSRFRMRDVKETHETVGGSHKGEHRSDSDSSDSDSDDEDGAEQVTVLECSEPPLTVEQRDVSRFVPRGDDWQSIDVVFDEMPLLAFANDSQLAETKHKATAQTTAFGHSLRVGGLLYVQTEAAKNFKERTALLAQMSAFYPPTHFVLLNTRRLTWTRQFLFLKADDTIESV